MKEPKAPHMAIPGKRAPSVEVPHLEHVSSRTKRQMAEVKPGRKTTEFVITAITVVGSGLVALGLITPEDTNAFVQAAGAVSAAIASVGYAIARARVKLGR